MLSKIWMCAAVVDDNKRTVENGITTNHQTLHAFSVSAENVYEAIGKANTAIETMLPGHKALIKVNNLPIMADLTGQHPVIVDPKHCKILPE